MKKDLVRITSSLLSLMALTFVSAASLIWIHQPEVPQELLKK